jgi:hypothetical protein
MYRDEATALDEHDRVVGAILIGEALMDSCERAVVRTLKPDPALPHDRWRAVAELHDTFPEVWRHLDRARRLLAGRGANTIAYDELRPHARRAPTRNDETASIERAAFDDVKRAIAELKLAVPGADWDGIEARTQDLVDVPLSRRRRNRVIAAGVIAAFGFALVTWFYAIMPNHKTPPAEVMHRELHQIQLERKLDIEALNVSLGARCDLDRARRLVKQLVLDGRGPDAANFTTTYVSRCGDDAVLEHWAHAPRPHHD